MREGSPQGIRYQYQEWQNRLAGKDAPGTDIFMVQVHYRCYTGATVPRYGRAGAPVDE